jgi:hypothetical protein
MIHQRPGIEAENTPKTAEQVENAKVKDQYQSEHSDPACEVLEMRRNHASNAEQEDRAEPDFDGSSLAFVRTNRCRCLSKESCGVHPGPTEQVCGLFPNGRLWDAGGPPSQSFAASIDGSSQEPHQFPGRHHVTHEVIPSAIE